GERIELGFPPGQRPRIAHLCHSPCPPLGARPPERYSRRRRASPPRRTARAANEQWVLMSPPSIGRRVIQEHEDRPVPEQESSQMGFFKQVKDMKAMVAEAPDLMAQSALLAENAKAQAAAQQYAAEQAAAAA